jgi:DNA helicase HerA-like ATPase
MLLLGLDADLRPYHLGQAERNRRILVAGTTGSGKSEALRLLARDDIFAGRGLVIFDMKGDREQA